MVLGFAHSCTFKAPCNDVPNEANIRDGVRLINYFADCPYLGVIGQKVCKAKLMNILEIEVISLAF
ncbi:Uncharacterised protein [Chlamydia trachomatis]|nr:Uncharacterised protein [Chlamydia trachomatis]